MKQRCNSSSSPGKRQARQPARSSGRGEEEAGEAATPRAARESQEQRPGRPAAGAPWPSDGPVVEVEPRSEEGVAYCAHLYFSRVAREIRSFEPREREGGWDGGERTKHAKKSAFVLLSCSFTVV